MKETVLLIALALLPRGALPASPFDEVGNFYMQSFGPEDYDAGALSWAVVQAPDGLIYVANGDGLLEYDGVSWRLIPISNRSGVRSLSAGAKGRVFVGGEGELGYLAPDSSGRMRYVSLVDHVAPEDREFGDVWSIEKTSDGFFFRTNNRLFRWNGREMKVWRSETRFQQIFALGNRLYAQQEGVGLRRMDGDSLGMAPGGVLFQDKRIYGLVPRSEGAYLAVTARQGMFRCPAPRHSEAAYGKTVCTPFAPGLTDLLTALQPYRTTMVGEGIPAIATRRGGVVLLDRAGRLLRILNEASGLRDKTVRYPYVDRQGGLWLGLNNGLARVETGTPLSYWNKTSGLDGDVSKVARHQGRLYAATTLGVYSLASSSAGAAPRFLPGPGISAGCRALLSTPQGLLAGCAGGVYNIDDQQLIWAHDEHVLELYRPTGDPTLLYLGLPKGLVRMHLRAGRWTDAERIDDVREPVHTIVEDAQGRLWMGTYDGILRLEVARDPVARDPVITRFGEADGLPAGLSHTTAIAGRVAILTDGGAKLFRVHTAADSVRFVPDTTFDAFLPEGSRSIEQLTEDDQGRVWIAAGEDSGVAHPATPGGYTWAPTALRRVSTRDILTMHVETDGSMWVGGPHGLIRYDTNHSFDPKTSYPVRIRRITTSADSALYHGRPGNLPTEWPYRDNTLRFAFAAPRYDAPERTHYRTRLDGFDRAATGDDWSAWVNESYKDYTNLWEGRYVFRVQARDVYGFVSREDTFSFRILPPWYRSWWAYSLYVLAFAAVVLAYVRFRREQLQRERQAAERERQTAERERAVSTRLREVDRLKDEFLANTSHELKTPLYGITGLAESLIDGAAGDLPEAAKANLAMITANGRRLSHLVDDILDFSQLRHKNLELNRQSVELRALSEVVLALSRSLTGSKELELVNAVPENLPSADADENRLQQILYNLVGNAVKFTETGTVEVSAAVVKDQLVVRVTDTGVGIPAEQQERIFAAFEQADASVQREYGGTGLGLAVTRQLVELHGGHLGVKSRPGEGSTFSFNLPMAKPTEAVPPTGVLQPSVPRSALGAFPVSEPTATATEWTSSGAGTILIVDDEPVNLRVLSNHLASAGYEIELAASGPDALSRLEDKTIDLVILDVMMPRMSGYEVCQKLRVCHSREELPVIFLTARSRTSDLVTGLTVGANDFLVKPVAKDELVSRVRTHLELLDMHRELTKLGARSLDEVKILQGLLPICCVCKKIRDDGGYWSQIEIYLDAHSEAEFSHGICAECIHKAYPSLCEDSAKKSGDE